MRAVDIIQKKRSGGCLDADEIRAFVSGATSQRWPDYQISALLMAMALRGMTATETASLTESMVSSGVRLDFSELTGPKLDKHSTGGVGDKTSLVIAPLLAACGVYVPMISGRGLAHTGGTLDKLEAIPGFQVNLSLAEFRTALAKVGCAMISQTAEIVPADQKLYALRDVTATVDSIPLICASIMSKKIAEGISGLVIDVKCGRGAFMKTEEEARTLGQSLVEIGRTNGVRTEAVLTAMDAPLGCAVGNALEVIEALETLKGHGPHDLEALCIYLSTRLLCLAGTAINEVEAEKSLRAALNSGKALETFRKMIAQQHGELRVVDDYSRLPVAPHRTDFVADREGFIMEMDAELVGRAMMGLGAGRDRLGDAIDLSVGCILKAKVGQRIRRGEPIVELHYREECRLDATMALLQKACRIGDEPPKVRPLILETLR